MAAAHPVPIHFTLLSLSRATGLCAYLACAFPGGALAGHLTMIRMNRLTVHHLDESRSQRIWWLLEELHVPYDGRRAWLIASGL